jgi:hypothetical protein
MYNDGRVHDKILNICDNIEKIDKNLFDEHKQTRIYLGWLCRRSTLWFPGDEFT